MRCPHCGGETPAEGVFCDHCGRQVQSSILVPDSFGRFLRDAGARVATTLARGAKYRFITFDNGLVMYVYRSPSRSGGPGISIVHFALIFDKSGGLLKQTAEQVAAWWKVFRGFRKVGHVGPLSGSLLYPDMEKIALRLGAGRWGVPALEIHRWRIGERFPEAPEWRAMVGFAFSSWQDHGREVAAELDSIATVLVGLMKANDHLAS